MNTWQREALVALVVLALPVCLLGVWADPVQWFGVIAVWVSFMHAQVSDRLSAKQAARARRGAPVDVECHAWERRYFVGKEALWCVYFVALEAWPALTGVALFLGYRWWRGWRAARRAS